MSRSSRYMGASRSKTLMVYGWAHRSPEPFTDEDRLDRRFADGPLDVGQTTFPA